MTINYLAIASAAVYDRWRNPQRERPYRMPVWPFWPLVAIVGCVAVLFKQTGHNEGIVAMVLGGAVIYYVLVLWPLRKTHWILFDPNEAASARDDA